VSGPWGPASADLPMRHPFFRDITVAFSIFVTIPSTCLSWKRDGTTLEYTRMRPQAQNLAATETQWGSF